MIPYKNKFYICVFLIIIIELTLTSANNFNLSPKTAIPYTKNNFINELSLYPELLFIVKENQLVFNALLSDSLLRPVFLIQLFENKNEVGNIENLAPKLLNSIGGEQLINNYTGYYSGHYSNTIKYLKKNYKIIVGVTDRYVDKNKNPLDKNITLSGISSARTVYFPLEDGTWLSVKGAGFFKHKIQDKELPYYLGDTENLGLLNKFELSGIAIEHSKLKSSFLPQTLATREILKLPNENNTLEEVSKINEKHRTNVTPYLLYKRVVTPHRLINIYALNMTDILTVRNNISKALQTLNKIKTPFKNKHEWFQFIIKSWAENEAYKFNELIISSSLHAQDMQLGGQDEDTTELFNYNYALNNIALNIYYPEIFDLINDEFDTMRDNEQIKTNDLTHKEQVLLLGGIYNKLQPLITILSNNEEEAPIPDSPLERFSYFETFFKSFFSTVKSNHIIEKWLFTKFHIKDEFGVFINPIEAILTQKKYSFSVFHKDYNKQMPEYLKSELKEKMENDLLSYIQKWLRDEYILRNYAEIIIKLQNNANKFKKSS